MVIQFVKKKNIKFKASLCKIVEQKLKVFFQCPYDKGEGIIEWVVDCTGTH